MNEVTLLFIVIIVFGFAIIVQISRAAEIALARAHRIETAAKALYTSAHWRSTEETRLSSERETELWTELRDALRG